MLEEKGSSGKGTQSKNKVMSRGKNSGKKNLFGSWSSSPCWKGHLHVHFLLENTFSDQLQGSVVSIFLMENKACLFFWENFLFHLCIEYSLCWRTAPMRQPASLLSEGATLAQNSHVLPLEICLVTLLLLSPVCPRFLAVKNGWCREQKVRRGVWGARGIKKHAGLSFDMLQRYTGTKGIETVLGSSNTDLGRKYPPLWWWGSQVNRLAASWTIICLSPQLLLPDDNSLDPFHLKLFTRRNGIQTIFI